MLTDFEKIASYLEESWTLFQPLKIIHFIKKGKKNLIWILFPIYFRFNGFCGGKMKRLGVMIFACHGILWSVQAFLVEFIRVTSLKILHFLFHVLKKIPEYIILTKWSGTLHRNLMKCLFTMCNDFFVKIKFYCTYYYI